MQKTDRVEISVTGGIQNGESRGNYVNYVVVPFGRDTISIILPSSSSGA